jgi:hypothetical protein
MDPDDPEIASELEAALRLIGDTALCGNDECQTIFWDRTKSMDELLFNMGTVDLRQRPPGDGSPFGEFKDTPDS